MASLSDLTTRQLEILQLVISGFANKTIAAKLHICEKTVEFHLDRIYTKVGARTRSVVSVWAVRHGMANGDWGNP